MLKQNQKLRKGEISRVNGYCNIINLTKLNIEDGLFFLSLEERYGS